MLCLYKWRSRLWSLRIDHLSTCFYRMPDGIKQINVNSDERGLGTEAFLFQQILKTNAMTNQLVKCNNSRWVPSFFPRAWSHLASRCSPHKRPFACNLRECAGGAVARCQSGEFYRAWKVLERVVYSRFNGWQVVFGIWPGDNSVTVQDKCSCGL